MPRVSTPATRYRTLWQRGAGSASRRQRGGPPRQAGGGLVTGALVVFTFLFLTVDLATLFAPPGTQAGNVMSANAGSRLIKLALLGISIGIMLRHVPLTRAVLKRVNIFFLGFLILVPLSTVWSIWSPEKSV